MGTTILRLALTFLAMGSALCIEVQIQTLPHHQLVLGRRSDEYTTPCNQTTYFMVDAEEPCMDLQINVTHTAGEPNLYVSKGLNKYPSVKNLAWSSYNWGGESMVISSADPNYHTGTYYIGVNAYCGSDVKTGHTDARYTVLVSHVQSASSKDDLYGKQKSGNLQANQYFPFRFCAPKQCVNISVTLKHCMSYDEPGCKNSYGYPELLISKNVPQPKVTDMAWMLAEIPRRTILLSPSEPNFEPGHYFVSVYGWCTPDPKCLDRKTCGPCDLTANLDFTLSVTPVKLDEDTCKQMMEGRQKPGDCTTGGASLLTWSIMNCVLFTAAQTFLIQEGLLFHLLK